MQASLVKCQASLGSGARPASKVAPAAVKPAIKGLPWKVAGFTSLLSAGSSWAFEPEVPELSLPELSLPEFSLPEVSLPQVSLPAVPDDVASLFADNPFLIGGSIALVWNAWLMHLACMCNWLPDPGRCYHQVKVPEVDWTRDCKRCTRDLGMRRIRIMHPAGTCAQLLIPLGIVALLGGDDTKKVKLTTAAKALEALGQDPKVSLPAVVVLCACLDTLKVEARRNQSHAPQRYLAGLQAQA